MIRPENQTDFLLLFITKNCETNIKETHTKPEKILEFKVTELREKFSFKLSPNLGLDSNWRKRFTKLEVYNPIFNITEEDNKLEIYEFPDSMNGGISYAEARDGIKKTRKFQISQLPIYKSWVQYLVKIKEKRYQKMTNDKLLDILAGYTRYVF